MKIKALILCRNFKLAERVIRTEDKDFDFANGTYLVDNAAITRDTNPSAPTLIYHQGNAVPRGAKSSVSYIILNVWWPATLRGMSNRSLKGGFKFGEFIQKLLDPRVWPLYFIAIGLLYHFLGGGGAQKIGENVKVLASLWL